MTTPRTLTADQQAAVSTADPVCLVLAPAGSGKTEILIRRAIRILSESAGHSHRILAVTFTLKAASELKERVQRSVGEDAWRVTADTIHGFALDWLLRFGAPVGVAPNAVVYAQDVDRLALLRRALEPLTDSVASEQQVRDALGRIDVVRTDRLDETMVPGERIIGIDLPFDEVVDAYVAALREAGGIDFPGMLDLLIHLLEIDPSVAKRFRRTYRHALIDEGQDLTRAQTELLRLLVGDDTHLFVVADDRQAINAWAGGGIEWARRLVGPEATVLQLRHNFRCATEILEVARRVAQHFVPPRSDANAPIGTPTGSVEVASLNSEQAEATFVANWIEEHLTNGLARPTLVAGESVELAPEEIGVIGRTRYVLDAVSTELERRGRLVSLQTDINALLATAEARVLHALLELRHNPNDRPAWRRASEELVTLLQDPFADGPVGPQKPEVNSLLEMVRGTPIEPLALSVIALDDGADAIDNFVRSLNIAHLAAEAWPRDADRIAQWWATYCAGTRVHERSIGGFLRHLFVVQRSRPDDPGIRLLTTHRAKGLEFRAVAVIGLTQGGFPDYRAVNDPDALAEERRAFYVAITRASRALVLTWPQQRQMRYGGIRLTQPSQFLEEADLDAG